MRPSLSSLTISSHILGRAYLGACQRTQVEPSQFTKYELELPATRTTVRTPMVPAIGTVVCPSAATCSDCPAEVKTLRFASCNLRLKNYQNLFVR